MGLRDLLFGSAHSTRMAAPRPAAQFGVDVPPEMLEAMTGSASIAPRISRAEALQVPAVLRARNFIAGTLSSLPHVVRGPDKREVPDTYLLNGNIDPDLPNSVMLAMTYEDLLFEGVAWWQVTRFGWHGYPVEAVHVPVGSVNVAQTGGLLPSQMRVTADQPFPADGQVYIDGRPVPDEQIIRFDSPNPPMLRHAARAIRTCLKLEKSAALYSDDPLPLGYFTPKEGSEELEENEVQELLDAWETARATRSWGYVGNLDAKSLQWSPEQLQLAAARQHAVLEIARAAGLDPEELGVSTTSRTYANQEQRWQAQINTNLGHYTTAVEQRLSMRDVLPRGYIAKVNYGALLRGDTLTRMQTYEIGLRVGAVAPEEVRDLEDRPALTPAQQAVLRERIAPSAIPPAMPQNPAAQQEADVPAHAFKADPGSVTLQFDTPEVAESFQVDADRRTIVGLAVPWNTVARSGFSKWRFESGSLRWSDSSRVKLNLHHDREQLVGYASRLQSGNAGLMATFKIARGPEGDRALSLAEDKILDGLSIEIDFNDETGDTWQPDPSDESVRLVRQATLRGAALTGTPAFDDARLTSVKASRDNGGAPMTTSPVDDKPEVTFDFEAYTTQLGQAMAESHRKLTEGLASSLGESISAGVKAALESLPSPQDGPQPVRAARYTVTREAPIYAFNGVGNSLVRDAWYAAREHDDDAVDRLRKYRKQTEESAKLMNAHLAAQFTPQSTSTASQIIPPGYRPDLYVPQLQQGRPMVSACSRGTIDNATPFVVPVFSTVTGATADHVEGTNPSDGSLTFTTKTVTPGAVSGRLVLTREIVDSSNPAIDAISVAAMNESYARQTEAKVYTLLNGANGAGGTITGDFVPSGAQASTTAGGTDNQTLVKHIRERLAKYPFNRFAAPGVALMGQGATVRLATAVDTTQRPLFPSVLATNAVGVGNAFTQGWLVDGLGFIPAWAMTGVAAGDSQIMILNAADCWVWESPLLTFRFEEKQGPANIELNVFGYFATHLLRPVGLSGIRIT